LDELKCAFVVVAGQGVTTRNSWTIPRSYNAEMRRHKGAI